MTTTFRDRPHVPPPNGWWREYAGPGFTIMHDVTTCDAGGIPGAECDEYRPCVTRAEGQPAAGLDRACEWFCRIVGWCFVGMAVAVILTWAFTPSSSLGAK